MEADLDLFINQNNSDLLCTVFIDADRFKGINDNFGHDAGDRVLIYLAKKLQKYAKILNGEVYRYGGEEFVILCFIKKSELISKLNDLRAEIKAQRIYHKIRDISVTVSMGISFFSECKSKDEMLIKADKGVYKAKSNGRDRVEFG
jgi:diguanylate cyclase (GGDEF)-like protein